MKAPEISRRQFLAQPIPQQSEELLTTALYEPTLSFNTIIKNARPEGGKYTKGMWMSKLEEIAENPSVKARFILVEDMQLDFSLPLGEYVEVRTKGDIYPKDLTATAKFVQGVLAPDKKSQRPDLTRAFSLQAYLPLSVPGIMRIRIQPLTPEEINRVRSQEFNGDMAFLQTQDSYKTVVIPKRD